ncbi:hypothetical protein VTN49DRAFT_2076 [Thermomyces lanuginosus]|uniref:uncharacterized protein n=1 Tax=Thermomyces lanuginosus TaxID=5541 RepID=UPI00374453A5
MDGDLVAKFTEITGSTPELATQYLQIADFDIEQAMQLYFENGGADLAQASQPATRPSAAADDDDVIIDEARSTAPPRPQSTVEDDAALARRLQEEFYNGGDTSDGIRAPLARTTETLVEPDVDHSAFLRQMHGPHSRRSRPGIFNQQEDVEMWHDDSEASSKSKMLAEMYRPPFDIISRLPWDLAREEGREKEKWLMVNVQDPSIFDCQILNRDLWKDPGVKEAIRENFIFLQYTKDDPRAAPYLQYYFQASDVSDNYPHIAIVDPRTGEQVKVWSGPPVVKPADFLMQLYEFLDRYSLKHNVRNPVARRKPDLPREKKLDTMTEDEMVELAMRNSLGDAEVHKITDPDELTRSVDDIKGKGKETTDAEQQAETEKEEEEEDPHSAAFRAIPSDRIHKEPPADPATTTRIQFRHPSGRVIRRFALSDPVRRIYEWLKSEPPLKEKAGVEFELNAMGKNLIEDLDTSIQDAGLKNGTVMIGYLE